jgi:hypothetical protein
LTLTLQGREGRHRGLGLRLKKVAPGSLKKKGVATFFGIFWMTERTADFCILGFTRGFESIPCSPINALSKSKAFALGY